MAERKTYNNEDLKTVARHEANDRLRGSEKDISNVVNGSMAPDLEEMRELGQDMDGMSTNSTLKKEGLVSDPQQDEADRQAGS
ncbi:hypothetical protein J31TS4_33340 [Paenibacillus sp. J31TS4]|uniref:hypothetical protein n=1 Tax=Paenibacillus sp. J31TS4 TaxID=2807195 RepID=UPI001B12654C|nr:hypothetical protein [Paenibacillus sp. J31TS4]GIP40054.1 hypothetical protein J31TS4_33340 [Paenibacillus sp. J31TS4]